MGSQDITHNPGFYFSNGRRAVRQVVHGDIDHCGSPISRAKTISIACYAGAWNQKQRGLRVILTRSRSRPGNGKVIGNQ